MALKPAITIQMASPPPATQALVVGAAVPNPVMPAALSMEEEEPLVTVEVDTTAVVGFMEEVVI